MAKKISQLDPGLPVSGGELIEIVQNAGSYSLPISGIGIYLIENTISNPNEIINSSFDFWQRGSSQTAVGYDSADRWYAGHSGSTKTVSRESFTLGQSDVPGNPQYFYRTDITTNSGSSDYVHVIQPIEYVDRLSNQIVTLSFYAKADASRNIATEFYQYFGTGGSPSSTVTAINPTTFSLTTSWKRFSLTGYIPSVSGNTIGTNGDDYLGTTFWFDAGSDYNSRTNSLGNQSGIFDIAQVKLERGNIVSPYIPRLMGDELALCQRFYENIGQGSTSDHDWHISTAQCTSTTTAAGDLHWRVRKRSIPTVTMSSGQLSYSRATGTRALLAAANVSFGRIWEEGCQISISNASSLVAGDATKIDLRNAYIAISSEL